MRTFIDRQGRLRIYKGDASGAGGQYAPDLMKLQAAAEKLENLAATSTNNFIVRNHELLQKIQPHVGKPVNSIPVENASTAAQPRNKGGFGNYIQEHVYGIPANSDKNPDFKEHNVELKVTPVIFRNNMWVPKERLVFNIINFNDYSTNVPLKESTFWAKNKTTLIITYQPNTVFNNIKIVDAFIVNLDNHPQLEQIEKDYNIIVDKIVNGDAHRLSGRDTQLLEACTKGAGHGKDLRTQPNNTVLAKQRAFAFKARAMKTIIK